MKWNISSQASVCLCSVPVASSLARAGAMGKSTVIDDCQPYYFCLKQYPAKKAGFNPGLFCRVTVQAPDMDCIANICDKKTFLAPILAYPEDIIGCGAVHDV